MAAIRAIYRNGQLELLEPIDLEDGQEVQLQIVAPQIPLTTLIADMLTTFEPDDNQFDEDALLREIEQQLAGKRPLSEIIIEDR